MSQYYLSPNAGGFMSPSSQGSPIQKARTEASQSVRSMTIAQINNGIQGHTDAEIMIDGKEVGHITIVAHVISVRGQPTHKNIVLQDGSGSVEAKYWETQANTIQEEDVLNKYVRVTGILKPFSGKRYINATSVRPITDFNEIAFHFFDAVTSTLLLRNSESTGTNILESSSFKPNGTASGSGPTLSFASPYHAQSSINNQSNVNPNNSPIQQQVIQFISNHPGRDDGVSIVDIARSFGAGNSESISQAIEHLMDDGQIYTTTDDNHFALSN